MNMDSTTIPIEKSPFAGGPPSPRSPQQTSSADLSPIPQPKSGGAIKALLLVAALGIIALGAYFGGLIPH
jgi:hypothetical protein